MEESNHAGTRCPMPDDQSLASLSSGLEPVTSALIPTRVSRQWNMKSPVRLKVIEVVHHCALLLQSHREHEGDPVTAGKANKSY